MRSRRALRVLGRGRGCGDDLRRQCTLGQIVDALEAPTAVCGDLAGPEEPLERHLALAPPPPAGAATARALEVRHTDRPARANLGQHRFAEFRALPAEPSNAGPDAHASTRALHSPAQERLQLDGQKGSLVTPVLEQRSSLIRVGHPVEQRGLVRPEPREAGQIVRAHEHVDRVDLDQAEPAHHADEVVRARRSSRPRRREALRGQRDAARLGKRQRRVGRRSVAAIRAIRSRAPAAGHGLSEKRDSSSPGSLRIRNAKASLSAPMTIAHAAIRYTMVRLPAPGRARTRMPKRMERAPVT